MKYYTVPATGSGTEDDPYRPGVPPDTNWVGQMSGDSYLIATPKPLPAKQGRSEKKPVDELKAECDKRGLKYGKVRRWYVA